MLTRPMRFLSIFFLAPIPVDGHLGLAQDRPPHKPGNHLDQSFRRRHSGNTIDNVIDDAFIMAASFNCQPERPTRQLRRRAAAIGAVIIFD
jgi:hypothetical protein